MKLYRISRERHAYDLSGKGGLISSARWHDHLPVIYTSVNSSTCILEKFVHLLPGEIHNDLVMSTLIVPEISTSETLLAEQLPEYWKNYPAPEVLKRIGNAWLMNKSTALLFVPSVIDPMAQNVLINPLHSEAANIKVQKIEPFKFDNRLFASWK